MKKAFLLSKNDIKLSLSEALSLLESDSYNIYDNLLVLNTDFKDYNRLAYTKSVYELLFTCNKDNLKDSIDSFSWKKIYKKDYVVRKISKDSNFSEKDIGSMIWRSMESQNINPKVNMKLASTSIHIFVDNGVYFFLKLIKDLSYDFDQRKPHNRPSLHPSSLHPQLARAAINLTGIKNTINKNKIKKATLTDPFCGTGGILLEAGLMGFKCIGYDVDPLMIKRSEKNLKHYKIKDFYLELKDSTFITDSIDYIVTDLPYGRNTSPKSLKSIYSDFVIVLDNVLVKKAVIMLPDFIDHKELFKKTSLNIEKEFLYYLHKTLSKRIILVSKNNK